MFRNEHLPFALCMGLKESEFWEMNPRRMNPYIKAYEMNKQRRDEEDWVLGQYFLQALLASVGNMFAKKTSEPHKYPEKPFLSELSKEKSKPVEEELTREEIQKQTEDLFLKLRVMQVNFNNSKQQ